MYDHDFPKLRELDPAGMRWDRLCNDLFNETLGEGLKSKIREMEQRFLGKEKMPNKYNKKLTCHNYNEGYCTRSNCRFGQKQGHHNPPKCTRKNFTAYDSKTNQCQTIIQQLSPE
jgi:hypothetical protein